MSRLKDQIALISGAGRGIGRAIALRYAAEGATVAVSDIDAATAQAVAREIVAAGGKAECFASDIGKPEQCATLVAKVVERFARLDIMVNNAGVIRLRPLLEVTPEDWDFIHDVNGRGLFFALQAGARQMVKQQPLREGGPRGKIVNIASIAGRLGRPLMVAYASSKAVAISVTRSAAMELAPAINVNAICPGVVETEMWKQIDREWSEIDKRPLGSAFQDRIRPIPLKRPESPEDLTGMAVFLASADSDYVTGQSFNVDGGLVMS